MPSSAAGSQRRPTQEGAAEARRKTNSARAGVKISRETRELRVVKKLVTQGRRRGYLTVEDVNGALPEEVLSTDQLQEVMALFGEHEITVVDSQRPRATRRVQENRSRAETDGEGEFEGEVVLPQSLPLGVWGIYLVYRGDGETAPCRSR